MQRRLIIVYNLVNKKGFMRKLPFRMIDRNEKV